MTSSRARNEISFGRTLASEDPEDIWGWGSPAGKIRARGRARYIASGAELHGNSSALEIGCGSGLFTEYFAQTGARILALDISRDLLNFARSRGLPEAQIIFMEKSFHDLPENQRFDAVIGSSVLHHLEIEPALTKIYRLLKPGGKMSFAEPNLLNPLVFMQMKFRRFYPYVSPDEMAFTHWSITRLLNKTGFTEVKVVPLDWLHPSTPSMLIKSVKNIGRVLEAIPIVREFAGSLYIHCRRP